MSPWIWVLVAVVVYMLVSDPAPAPMANVYPPGYAAMNFDVPGDSGLAGLSDAAAVLYGAAPPVEADTAVRPSAARGWNHGTAWRGTPPPAPPGAPPAATDVWPPDATTGPTSQARGGRGHF